MHNREQLHTDIYEKKKKNRDSHTRWTYIKWQKQPHVDISRLKKNRQAHMMDVLKRTVTDATSRAKKKKEKRKVKTV